MKGNLRIGWASADLTPEQPVMVCGQFHARISEGVRDPITATAMAVETQTPDGRPVRCVMVSCDVAVISETLTAQVRQRLKRDLPEIDPTCVVMNATHTHCGPELRGLMEFGIGSDCGVAFDNVMAVDDYLALAADRITGAVAEAWRNRAPAGVGFGLGHAAIGYNRRICYDGGQTRMYGGIDRPDLSHVEAGADPSINVMGVWDADRRLTGVVVNVACPSQVSENEFQISADFWHETRIALREKFGQHLFVLPQVSAAGDIAPARPTTVPDYKALARAWELLGMDQRQYIAKQITIAVGSALEVAGRAIDDAPQADHRVERLSLKRHPLTDKDVSDARAEAASLREEYEALRQKLDADPAARRQPRWYVNITRAYRRMNWHLQVVSRFETQKQQQWIDHECHALRLGDGAFVTNGFEYYQDFGQQIKGRSPAAQTFVVQLAGPGGYLPTARAMAGGSYGAVPASIVVGPDGGRQLVEWSVDTLSAMYAEAVDQRAPAR